MYLIRRNNLGEIEIKIETDKPNQLKEEESSQEDLVVNFKQCLTQDDSGIDIDKLLLYDKLNESEDKTEILLEEIERQKELEIKRNKIMATQLQSDESESEEDKNCEDKKCLNTMLTRSKKRVHFDEEPQVRFWEEISEESEDEENYLELTDRSSDSEPEVENQEGTEISNDFWGEILEERNNAEGPSDCNFWDEILSDQAATTKSNSEYDFWGEILDEPSTATENFSYKTPQNKQTEGVFDMNLTDDSKIESKIIKQVQKNLLHVQDHFRNQTCKNGQEEDDTSSQETDSTSDEFSNHDADSEDFEFW